MIVKKVSVSKIVKLIETCGKNATRIAEYCDCDQAIISKLRRGRRIPSLKLFVKLLNALNVVDLNSVFIDTLHCQADVIEAADVPQFQISIVEPIKRTANTELIEYLKGFVKTNKLITKYKTNHFGLPLVLECLAFLNITDMNILVKSM